MNYLVGNVIKWVNSCSPFPLPCVGHGKRGRFEGEVFGGSLRFSRRALALPHPGKGPSGSREKAPSQDCLQLDFVSLRLTLSIFNSRFLTSTFRLTKSRGKRHKSPSVTKPSSAYFSKRHQAWQLNEAQSPAQYLPHSQRLGNKKKYFRGSFQLSIVTIQKISPSGYLKFNNLGIFHSLKSRILMEKILPISRRLNFTPDT